MRIIDKQSSTIIEQGPGIDGMFKHIEAAARTCYQSQPKEDDEDSARRMVNSLINNKHTAMLEHGTVYLAIPITDWEKDELYNLFIRCKRISSYSVVVPAIRVEKDEYDKSVMYVTTNYRVIVENDLEEIAEKYWSDPCDWHEKRITFRLTTNIQVATEYIRHRKFSFAMESTRYCCYDKEKFGDQIAFILPTWLQGDNVEKADLIEWSNAMQDAENHYMRSRARGLTAQLCAQYLPKATKSELVMTGFESDWKHFFDLRYFGTTGKPHPQAQELAELMYKELYPNIAKGENNEA